MCLAIPGRIIEFADDATPLARVDVGGVKRNINIGLLERNQLHVGDYVLIHVGFALSKIDEKQAEEMLRLLQDFGEYNIEIDQFKNSL